MASVTKEEIKPVFTNQILKIKCLDFLDFLNRSFWSLQREELSNKDQESKTGKCEVCQ